MGHQRRLRRLTSISALSLKADIRMIGGVRRCGPVADSRIAQSLVHLRIDWLVQYAPADLQYENNFVPTWYPLRGTLLCRQQLLPLTLIGTIRSAAAA